MCKSINHETNKRISQSAKQLINQFVMPDDVICRICLINKIGTIMDSSFTIIISSMSKSLSPEHTNMKHCWDHRQDIYIQLKLTIFCMLLTFSRTFSNDDGDTTEKQTRKTSVCGYDNGRSLS